MKNYDYIGQISNELKEIFGKELNVSKEGIYIYVFCKGELKKELREIKVSQESQIPDIRSISERPKEVLPYLGRRFNYEKIRLPLW